MLIPRGANDVINSREEFFKEKEQQIAGRKEAEKLAEMAEKVKKFYNDLIEYEFECVDYKNLHSWIVDKLNDALITYKIIKP
jgi:2-oxoglutarate dehydrogenase complex dehydrogenase (E1) component-like enzyme